MQTGDVFVCPKVKDLRGTATCNYFFLKLANCYFVLKRPPSSYRYDIGLKNHEKRFRRRKNKKLRKSKKGSTAM